jgi:hypothetical protein
MMNEVKKCLDLALIDYDNEATLEELIELLKKASESEDSQVPWIAFSYRLEPSEAFIREFQDLVYWPDISGCKKLSEDFIIEFRDKVDWQRVLERKNLSEEFWNRVFRCLKNIS